MELESFYTVNSKLPFGPFFMALTVEKRGCKSRAEKIS